MIILGKYALDKGIELGKVLGPKALDKATEMFGTVLDKLRARPESKPIADEYEKDPDTYQKPLEKKLDEAMKDPEFAKQLQALYEQFQQAAAAHDAGAAIRYSATLTGSGAIAQGAEAKMGESGAR